MSENLENSTARLIEACRSMKEWAEHILTELEAKQAAFQAGRAEIDRALAEMQEQRAKFIRESSVSIATETSQALDVLAERMESLLGGSPKAEAATPPSSSPPARVAQPPAEAVTPPPAPRTVAAEAADELAEAAEA